MTMQRDGRNEAVATREWVRRRSVDRYLNRKTFVTSLGVGGLGLAMTAAALGGALAQDAESTPAGAAEQAHARFDELHAELYAVFTAALAEEIGTGDAAQVDAGIREALAAVVDGYASDDLVTAGQATALKALIETVEVPVGPGPLLGHERVRFVRGTGPAGDLPSDRVEVAVAAGELPAVERQAMAERFYPDFTAALATALGAGSADEVDGAIRLAMFAVIDGLSAEEMPIPIPTDALKAMVATAESPLGPAMLFGPHPGVMIRAFQGHHGDGPGFHGRGHGGDDGWFGERGERERAGIWEKATDDDAAAGEEKEDEASS